MALSMNGPLGHVKGKLANIVFYTLNGQQVSRTIGRQKKPTRSQLANQQKMAVTMKTVKPMLDFIRSGFELEARGTTRNAFNLAVSHAKKHALQGEYPNISIDYNQVLVSRGELPAAGKTAIRKTDTGVILNWNPINPGHGANDDDLVMVMLYHPLKERCSVFLNAAKREHGEHFIPLLNPEMLDEPIEAYLCFKSADGSGISNSIYMGNLNGSMETDSEKKIKEKHLQLKNRFEQVETSYLKQQQQYFETGKKHKSFKHLEKEYLTLRNQLTDLPGKPV